MSSADYDFLFKVLLIGDYGVGKSCLLRPVFTDKHKPTIGVEFDVKQLKLNDGKIAKLQIWDTSGDVRYNSITTTHFRKSHGIVIVYDITSQKSFDNVRNMWLDMIEKHAPANVTKILVGNKSDQSDGKRQVDTKQASDFAASLGMSFLEASAKDGANVEHVFLRIANDIVATTQEGEAGNEAANIKKRAEKEAAAKKKAEDEAARAKKKAEEEAALAKKKAEEEAALAKKRAEKEKEEQEKSAKSKKDEPSDQQQQQQKLKQDDDQDVAASISVSAPPPNRCFKRGVPDKNLEQAARSILSIREAPPNRPDLQHWIPDDDDADDLLHYLKCALPELKTRPAIKKLIAENGLTDDEIKILHSYKSETPYPIYRWLNGWLGSSRRDDFVKEHVAPFFTLLYRAMEKLPRITVSAHRAIKVNNIPALKNAFDHHKTVCASGQMLSFWGFSSFSTADDVVNRQEFVGKPSEEAIVYSCGELEGVDMEPFAPQSLKSESEILPLCPCVLKVQTAVKMGKKLIVGVAQMEHDAFAYVVPTKNK